jgi:hypothetical protein
MQERRFYRLWGVLSRVSHWYNSGLYMDHQRSPDWLENPNPGLPFGEIILDSSLSRVG